MSAEQIQAPPNSDIAFRAGKEHFVVQELRLTSHEDRILAAQRVAAGELIGLENYRVFALIGDGTNPNAFDELCEVKGEGRRGRPVALALPAEKIVQVVDIDKVPHVLQPVFKDPKLLSRVTGSMFFWRIPLNAEYAAKWEQYHWLYSDSDETRFVQCWDSNQAGHTRDLIDEIISAGVDTPFITSMNPTGTSEITDWSRGLVFCHRRGVPIQVRAPEGTILNKGSYTTLTVLPSGSDYDIEITRDGNLPSYIALSVLNTALGQELRVLRDPQKIELDNLGNMLVRDGRTRYINGQMNVPLNLVDGLPPELAYEVFNAWTQGMDPQKLDELLPPQYHELQKLIIQRQLSFTQGKSKKD